MQWSSFSKRYQEALFRLFFPASCGLCQALLALEERQLCAACRLKVEANQYPIQERYFPRNVLSLDHVWALYPYEDSIKTILTSIKFQRKQWLLDAFSESLCETAAVMASETAYDGIIPIPMDPKKRIEREFNQADTLAKKVSEKLRIPINFCLEKPQATPAQSHMSQTDRAINLFRAFRVKEKNGVKDQKFLLLDDIFTTGATAEEAAKTLKTHGARRVDLLVIARTPKQKEVQNA